MKKLAAFFVGLVSGFALAVVAAFVQADRIYIAGRLIPYGMVLASMMVVLSSLWLARAFHTRLAPVGLLSGWVVVTFYIAMARPGADQVIFKTWFSTAFLFATAILGGMVCSLPPMRPTSVPLYERVEPELAPSETAPSETVAND